MKNDAPKDQDEENLEKQDTLQKQPSKNRGLSAVTAEIDDEIQLERREAYVEPLTRQLLRNLIESGEEDEIIPFYHPATGFTYEPKTHQKGNGPHKISRDFLENLVKLDILRKSFYDSISTCPNCESPALTLHHRCPKCKSHHIDKTSLTEHIPCGYIDQRSRYKQGLCPKCGKKLVESEYRDMGRWYICKECGERFEQPQFDLICRRCNNTFPIEGAKVLEIPKFNLNPKRMKEIRQNVASLENISKLLDDLGFKIEMPGSVTGHKSGMQYNFSLLAKKQIENQESIITVDHEVSEDEVQASPLILYIYKISETKVDLPIFIALPRLSETAKKIAKGQDILIIEGQPEGSERIAQIKAEIESRIARKIAAQAEPEVIGKPVVEVEEVPQVANDSSLNLNLKTLGTPFVGALRKLKRSKEPQLRLYSPVTNVPAGETQRHVVFLLDGSSSMKKRIGNLDSFDVAKKAIENVLMSPDAKVKENFLSVVVFWDEVLKGFQKKILYENVSMGTQIDPQKLSEFGGPKHNAGTPLWQAVGFAVDLLQNKNGQKTIKLITDAVDIPPLEDSATISKLKNGSIQLDCVMIGEEGNSALGLSVAKANLGRFFESKNVETLVAALKA